VHRQDHLIAVDELARRIDDDGIRIIDCRHDLFAPGAGRVAYLAAHIPGAVHANLDQDLAAPVGPGTGRHPLPAAAVGAATFGRMGISDRTFVVVYDERSGAVAARAWWMLRWLGHSKVAVLDGGLAAWQAQGLPLVPGDVSVGKQRFVARPHDDWTISTDDIPGALARGLLLVDARAENRFIGKHEPVDPIAGHIPGARNLPFECCLDASGRFLSPETLRELWAEALGDRGGSPWGVMCGSGVTACHLVLAAILAGLPEPKLYVGSWSEWIRNPERPVAGNTV
jgi:thiosulfate/3-mercaptopyruvate sulfurtransferase